MPLLTPTDISSYLGTTFDGGQTSRVQALIDATLADAGGILGYPLPYATRTATLDGGQRRVWLPVPPVAIDPTVPMVVTIRDAGTGLYGSWLTTPVPALRADASLELYGTGYGPDVVQVTYTAGWNDTTRPLPTDLRQALIELVAARWGLASAVSSSSSSGGSDAPVRSVTIGSYRTEYATGADTSGVTAKLRAQASTAHDTILRYRRVEVY